MTFLNLLFGMIESEDSRELIQKRLRREEDILLNEIWNKRRISPDKARLIPPDYDESKDYDCDIFNLSQSKPEKNNALFKPNETEIYQSVSKGRPQKIRAPVPKHVKVMLVKVRGGLCEHCKEEIYQQIHHLDGDPSNNDPDNLMLVCYECHKNIEKMKKKVKVYK